jgi:hypothetical protein
MSATLGQVLEDIAARVETVEPRFLQVHAGVPDSFSGPCAIVQPDPGDFIAYDPSMGSEAVDYRILVTIIVPSTDTPAAQKILYPYTYPAGPSSVRAAVQGGNRDLGTTYTVERARNIRPMLVGEQAAKHLAYDTVVRVQA